MANTKVDDLYLLDSQDRVLLFRSMMQISYIGTNSIAMDQVYQTFAREVGRLVEFDRAYITTVDPGSDNYVLRYAFGEHGHGRCVGDIVPLEGSLTQVAMKTGQTLNRGNVEEDLRVDADRVHLERGMRSCITVPLVYEGKVFGMLGLRSRRRDAFGWREEVILDWLAIQFASPMRFACLSEQILFTAQELALVDKVARLITDTPNIDEVYQQFALEMKGLVEFDRININVIDRNRDAFIFKYVSGEVQPGRRAGDVVPLENSQTQQVMATGQTLVRPDVAADRRFRGDEVTLQIGMRSTIMVPLVWKGWVIGNLSLRSRQVAAYGAREQAILERLARQIAPAIANAMLSEHIWNPENGKASSADEENGSEAGYEALNADHTDLATRTSRDPLTPREQEVLQLAASGASNADIAADLYISVHTVKRHIGKILQKLNAQNRTEAALAWKAGLE